MKEFLKLLITRAALGAVVGVLLGTLIGSGIFDNFKFNLNEFSFIAVISLLISFFIFIVFVNLFSNKNAQKQNRYSNFSHYSSLGIKESAYYLFTKWQLLVLLYTSIFLIMSFAINWHQTIIIFVVSLSALYFLDLIFNLFLIARSFSKAPEIKISNEEIASIKNEDWPMYTILCPLYKEWQVIPQFVSAISKLDYPVEKLQVILLLEEDDRESIENLNMFNLPSNFEIEVVPHSYPKTKPKACNFGLTKAKGEYLVIYDAEDIPEVDQLKKAVVAFKKSDQKVHCVQAKLNFYNPHQNILTKAFTAEYSLWFDLVLTGLQSINAPIPLGGTSNHFKTEDLKDLKGWDAFNVTEDCDLGIRLVKKGYKTAIIDSTTHEEANSDLRNWFWQRTRWIKGYMQTYLVHMRNPKEFLRDWKEPHVITFQLIVGGKILSMFINPIMWILTIIYFVFRSQTGTFIESLFPGPVLYIGVISLIFGNFLYIYYYMIGCAKRGHDKLVKYVFLVPFYWLAMSAAAWVALYKLVTNPHHWSKTKHGLHLNNNLIKSPAINI